MKILLTGVCGFVGNSLARTLLELFPGVEITGVDNFIRPGSESNRDQLRHLGVKIMHGDVRASSDVDALPSADWVIDAAANPSVLAGLDGLSSSRQVVEHNLFGTVNLLEYCRKHQAGWILLSTSRVYSIPALTTLPLQTSETRFHLASEEQLPTGMSRLGITESFSTTAPISLYGATKLASEILSLEYAESFGIPVWINRCGVLAGAGQFGRADQGIVAYWIHSYLRRQPLRYIGFGGAGLQVRDALHPRDLGRLIMKQLVAGRERECARVVNLGGGMANTFSLLELSQWCAKRFGFEFHIPADAKPRAGDLPWVVVDNSLANRIWDWSPEVSLADLFEEVAQHAEDNPEWLRLSAPFS